MHRRHRRHRRGTSRGRRGVRWTSRSGSCGSHTAARAQPSAPGCSTPPAISSSSPTPTWRRRPTRCRCSSHALRDHDVALGSRIQPDGSDMRATQPGYRRLLGRAFHLAGFGLGRRSGPGHAVRVQGLHRGRPGPLRSAADHEHRVRRRAHLPRPHARLLDMAIVPIRWFDKRGSRMRARPRPRRSRRLGPVPHPADPPRRAAGRRASATLMDRRALGRLGEAALPVVAICRSSAGVGLTLASRATRSASISCAYHQAAGRLLAGQPLYDMSFTETRRLRPVLLPADLRADAAAAGLLSARPRSGRGSRS